MENNNQRIKIYTDGSGDGRFCYYKPMTREIGRRQIEGLTNNESEYKAILLALLHTRDGEKIIILSDSKVVINQLNLEWYIKSARLREIFDDIHAVIADKKLDVIFKWLPRNKNRAGKYLG